jgi:uncharacterized protein
LGLGLLASGLVIVGFSCLPPASAMTALVFNQALAGPILSLGYAAAMTLYASEPVRQHQLRPLAMAGRMPLTNYLMQSLVCALIFDGYALGLAGKIGPTVTVALAVVIFCAQMAFSSWWLARFRFGPMEWLWRLLTYGRRPVMVEAAR